MFEAAQVQLARSKQRARRNRKAEYLLIGGRLRCGRCGRSLTGRYDGRDGTRSYRCTSYAVYLDPTLRCRGTLRADLVEPAVWRAVTDVLEDPARIAQGMTQYEAEATQRRASMAHERSLVQAQRERCDRKAQRWAEAYGAGVIDLQKFKSYKAEIEARRLGLLEQEARLTQEGEALEAEALTWDAVPEYCRRVREALTRFTMDEQRITLEALDIQVCWTPDRPFVITGRIPMDTFVPTTSR